jgi:hypothetical protein
MLNAFRKTFAFGFKFINLDLFSKYALLVPKQLKVIKDHSVFMLMITPIILLCITSDDYFITVWLFILKVHVRIILLLEPIQICNNQSLNRKCKHIYMHVYVSIELLVIGTCLTQSL